MDNIIYRNWCPPNLSPKNMLVVNILIHVCAGDTNCDVRHTEPFRSEFRTGQPSMI